MRLSIAARQLIRTSASCSPRQVGSSSSCFRGRRAWRSIQTEALPRPSAVPWLVGASSKLFLNLFCKRTQVSGLAPLLRALEDPTRGVLTVSNHVSVLDDPLAWGMLPLWTYRHPRALRWTLGASDICFTKPWHAWFFRQGQTVETFRGKGIYQHAIDDAARLLARGQWVHIFPEGRVKQDDRPLDLRPFKWGVSRVLLEAAATCKKEPYVVPIWIRGFDEIMPEETPKDSWLPRRLPRAGASVSLTIGAPANDLIMSLVKEARANPALSHGIWRPATPSRHVHEDLRDEPHGLAITRSRIAALLKEQVEQLGRDTDAGTQTVEATEQERRWRAVAAS